MIKKVLTPIQFFNKLPVDIIGQNNIKILAKDKTANWLYPFLVIILNNMNKYIINKVNPNTPVSTSH